MNMYVCLCCVYTFIYINKPRRVHGILPIQVWRSEKQTSIVSSSLSPSLRTRETYVLVQRQSHWEWILPYFTFYSIPILNGLDEVHPHWGRQSLLNLWIQIFFSSQNILIDTFRIMFNQISRHSVAQSRLMKLSIKEGSYFL